MAAITVNTANSTQTTRVYTAICSLYGFTGFLADGETIQSPGDFVKAYIARHLKNETKRYEAQQAAIIAAEAANVDVESNISITY